MGISHSNVPSDFKLHCFLPVNMDAMDLSRLNCVSKYLGRKTMNPETMMSSVQAPKQVKM